MPISVSHIVDALVSLGGEAHLKDIVQRVNQIAPAPIPKSVSNIVSARIQENSSDADSFKKKADIFQSVHGVKARKGYWRLRQTPLNTTRSTTLIDGAEIYIEESEGQAKLRLHLSRERSRKLVKAFKSSLNDPRCEACGFNFNEKYGALGNDYIEAHHKLPVANLVEGSTTKLSDLAALCANCHRVIHANGLMSVEELAHHLKKLSPQ